MGLSGESVDGKGYNSSGVEVYNDGIDDGNIYYLGDYSGDKLTSKSQLNSVEGGFQTVAENFNFIEGEGLDNFVFSQMDYVDQGDLNSVIGQLSVSNDPSYQMETHAFEDAVLQPNGTYNTRGLAPGNYSLTISNLNKKGRPNKALFNDINLIRRTLVHESFHVEQGLANYFSGKTINISNVREFQNSLERDAYKRQLNHWTINNLNSTQVNTIKQKL